MSESLLAILIVAIPIVLFVLYVNIKDGGGRISALYDDDGEEDDDAEVDCARCGRTLKAVDSVRIRAMFKELEYREELEFRVCKDCFKRPFCIPKLARQDFWNKH